jgi:nucleoside-diphosphate-sugar epimerase
MILSTIKELARKVLDLIGTDSDIVYESLPEDDPDQRRPGITRAREELNWEPEIPLRQGLQKTSSYFKSNK